ncbi:MAG: SIS domain-containing protein [Fervidicoccaceae archaeon]
MSGRAFFEEALNNWKNLALKGIDAGEREKCDVPSDVKRVIVAGMGGSGIVGDFLSDLSSYYSFPFEIVAIKGDFLPFKVDREDLVLLVSYSGNTIETLSVYRQVEPLKNWVAITSGGELFSKAISSGGCVIRLTEGLFPRLDLPEILFSIASFLGSRFGLHVFSRPALRSSLSIFDTDYSSEAKNLAEHVNGTVPLFIVSRPYISVAVRMKNDLAENSKVFSNIEVIPEALHNTIEALPSIRDPFRIFIVKGKYTENNIFVSSFIDLLNKNMDEIWLKGESILQELLYGYKLSTLVSLEVSSMEEVDPYKTEMIDRYKKILKNKLEASEHQTYPTES